MGIYILIVILNNTISFQEFYSKEACIEAKIVVQRLSSNSISECVSKQYKR
jgi:hypothetical protein